MTNTHRPARCTWSVEDGWLTAEGRPCPRAHCAFRRNCARHVDLDAGVRTCPACIGKVRHDLHQLVALVPHLPAEAQVAGVDSEAANLAGPAASGEQMHARAQREPDLELDPHHPAALLTRWEVHRRARTGSRSDLFATMSSASHYLLAQLATAWPHEDEFAVFAQEVFDCMVHLEQTLHDSRRGDEGARCPSCAAEHGEGPRLRRRHAEHGASPCPRVQRDRPCRVCLGVDDSWHCPANPEHWWPEPDYRARVAADYLEHADRLTASDLERQHKVNPSTLRSWVRRGQIKPAGRDADGRVLYPVSQARSLLAGQPAG